MAALGGLLAGRSGVAWFGALRRPRMQMPISAFYATAGIVYVMYAAVIYRLLALDLSNTPRIICLTSVGAVMAFGEFWNYLFFGMRSPGVAFGALTACIPLLVVIETALFLSDPVSGWVLLPYGVYTLAYSLPWCYRVWRLNAPNG
jgi:benzodiazapine receptor